MQVLVDFTRLIVLDALISRRVEPENLKIDRNLPEQSNHIDSSIRRTSRCNWDRSLVPKSGGQTRLIFHLSYEFGEQEGSLNHHTPDHLCSVKYQDLDSAARTCLKVKQLKLKNLSLFFCDDQEGNTQFIFLGKSDIKSAFRLLPLSRDSWKWLIMMAKNPITGRWQFFVDKCLPFGASISCALFQRFSNALKYLIQYKTAMDSINNYLDDFLFVAATMIICNFMIQSFLDLCNELGVPIAIDKTEWASIRMIFLGILLDGEFMTFVIPEEKRVRAIDLVRMFIDRKKATVRELQILCGYLNFLNKAIIPGRAFTRRMYAKYSSKLDLKSVGFKMGGRTNRRITGHLTGEEAPKKLMPHHHVRLDREFKLDCEIWLKFLTDVNLRRVVNRPMIDVLAEKSSQEINFYSDASKSEVLGFGCYLGSRWIYGQWPDKFIKNCDPSIEYLELYALTAGILTWENRLTDTRITVFCDNQAVVHMINNNSSKCKHCMKLIRLLTLNGLQFNRRLRAKFVRTKDNGIADAISRLQFDRFRRLAPHMNKLPDDVDDRIWPVVKIWG